MRLIDIICRRYSYGITPLDIDIANLLRPQRKPVLVIANKTDSSSIYHYHTEFYQLGSKNLSYFCQKWQAAGNVDVVVELYQK